MIVNCTESQTGQLDESFNYALTSKSWVLDNTDDRMKKNKASLGLHTDNEAAYCGFLTLVQKQLLLKL